LPKFENLKSWPENVQTSLNLPKLIIKYLNLCIGGVLLFGFEKVCICKVKFKFRQITALAGAYDNRQRQFSPLASAYDSRQREF
jgi:hypothetical protein